MEDKIKELGEISKPVVDYLKNNWDTHCTVVITDSHIRLVRDEIGIPVKDKEAPEVPAQEQSNITFDFGVLEPSRFYITTDKSFYDGMKENPKFVPMFTLNDFKESLHISTDSQLYIFRILQE